MFPFWSKTTEEQTAAMRAARQEQIDEHEAAVQRLADAQQTGGVTPPEDIDLPGWDGPNAGPGPSGAGR